MSDETKSTELENIERIQKSLANIKRVAKEEVARAQEGGNPALINAWSKVFHSTGVHHGYLTDLLLENYPGYADVVARGPGGR